KYDQVMNYPKGSDNYFICTDEVYKYPGLVANKLANNDKYKYLPCCYKVNQKTGNKSWNVYLKNEEKSTRVKTSNIITKMEVEYGKMGYLPRNIYYILHEKLKQGEEFIRYGVPFSKNSFISTILLALDPAYEGTID